MPAQQALTRNCGPKSEPESRMAMMKRFSKMPNKSIVIKVTQGIVPLATMCLGLALGYWLKSTVRVQEPEKKTPEIRELQRGEVPQKFERKIAPGTELARIKQRYETRLAS